MIRHLRHADIDKAWWDDQLSRCADRLWYAQSWVLDIASPGWEALLDDESGAIMPLTWRRKYGVDYLHQPFSLQQLGVFAPAMTAATTTDFLAAVPRCFRYWDIWLNASMNPTAGLHDRLHEQVDQVVALDADAAVIRAGYSDGHKRNLRKAGNGAAWEQRPMDPTTFVRLFERTTALRFGGAKKGEMEMLEQLITAACDRGQCSLPALWLDGMPIAAICFVRWGGRLILLKSANDERGNELRAMFHLVDAAIMENTGSGVLFDFAGSNTPSVARFNAGFGARPTVYLRLVRNRLPAPLRWIKR